MSTEPLSPSADPLAGERVSSAPSRAAWLILLPFAGLLAVYVVMGFISAGSILTRHFPITPWESAIVADAWRVTRGLPVYTDPARDHATHMYGPLVTYLTALGVKLRGVDVTIPRYLSFFAALLTCAFVGWLAAFNRYRGRLDAVAVFLLGFALVFVEFYRVVAWFTEARPDMAAILCSLISLCCFYRASLSAPASLPRAIQDDSMRSRPPDAATGVADSARRIRDFRRGVSSMKHSLGWTILAVIALLTGFFLKQTAAAVALIPPVAMFATGAKPIRRQLPLMLAGGVAMAITLFILKLAFPWVYFHMVTIAAGHAIVDYPIELFQLISGSTLFIAAFFVWIMCEPEDDARQRMILWTLSAVAVLTFTGTAAVAKVGGYFNSHLPTVVAMTLFVLLVLPDFLIGLMNAEGMLGRRVLTAIVLPLLLASDMLIPTRRLDPAQMVGRHGHPRYAGVVKAVSQLPGKVICPEDPTIPIKAKNFAGRSWECDLDAVARRRIPDYCFDELRSADWLVQVEASRKPLLSRADLTANGFDFADGILPENSVYTLWKRR